MPAATVPAGEVHEPDELQRSGVCNRPANRIFKPMPDFATMGPAHSVLEAPPCLCLPATTIGRP